MALPQQLMTSPTRIISSDLGSTIPTKLGNLESALCDIFGFTANSNITVSPLSLSNDGKITKALVLQAAAGPVGWRFRNSTNSKEMRVAVVGTNLDFDENTGSEAVPVWTNRFRIAISTGALTGQAFTSTTQGLVPASGGSASTYLDGSGAFSTPASATATSCRLRNSTTQSLASTTFVTLNFDTEDWDNGSMHSGANPSRITMPTAGKYLLVGQTGFTANSQGRRIVGIHDSSGTEHGRGEVVPGSASVAYATCMAIVNASAASYYTLWAYQDSGSTLTTTSSAQYSPQFAAYKIGG